VFLGIDGLLYWVSQKMGGTAAGDSLIAMVDSTSGKVAKNGTPLDAPKLEDLRYDDESYFDHMFVFSNSLHTEPACGDPESLRFLDF
jgi:hypothetical protein